MGRMSTPRSIMTARIWRELGIDDVRLEINSLGNADERAAYRQKLIAHYEAHLDALDDEAKGGYTRIRCASSTARSQA